MKGIVVLILIIITVTSVKSTEDTHTVYHKNNVTMITTDRIGKIRNETFNSLLEYSSKLVKKLDYREEVVLDFSYSWILSQAQGTMDSFVFFDEDSTYEKITLDGIDRDELYPTYRLYMELLTSGNLSDTAKLTIRFKEKNLYFIDVLKLLEFSILNLQRVKKEQELLEAFTTPYSKAYWRSIDKALIDSVTNENSKLVDDILGKKYYIEIDSNYTQKYRLYIQDYKYHIEYKINGTYHKIQSYDYLVQAASPVKDKSGYHTLILIFDDENGEILRHPYKTTKLDDILSIRLYDLERRFWNIDRIEWIKGNKYQVFEFVDYWGCHEERKYIIHAAPVEYIFDEECYEAIPFELDTFEMGK